MKTIDLGLHSGTLWDDCNLGENQPTECGNYFAWGDTQPKSNYVGRTCKTYDLDIARLKMDDYVDGNNVLFPDCDAASQLLGVKWNIPSSSQAQELIAHGK